MMFQAFRTRYAVSGSYSSRNHNGFISTFPSFCVPCGPARSSFSAAFEDVRSARDSGFVAAVRVINPIISY